MATPAVLARLFTRPCTLILREQGAPDVYGNAQWDETRIEARCYAEQRSASEPGDPHYQAEEFLFLFPAGTALDGLDAIDLDGMRFEALGPPWIAHDPRANTAHHIELRARRRAE